MPEVLGILLRSLGPHQLAQSLLASAHALYAAGSPVDVIAFTQDAVIPQQEPAFAQMNLTEAFGFAGVAVATSLATAEALLRCPGPRARYLYAWDLEWMRSPGRPYERTAAVYRGLPVIARGEEHRRLLEELWQARVVGVVADGDLAGLAALTKG